MWNFNDIFWNSVYGSYVLSAALLGGDYEAVAIDLNCLRRCRTGIASNIRKEDDSEEILKYDKGAIFLVFLLSGFAVLMGMIEYFMSYADVYML